MKMKKIRGIAENARAAALYFEAFPPEERAPWLFLAIERLDPAADNYDERVKRRDFYLRGGLLPMGMNVQEGSVVYELLGCGGKVAAEEYSALIADYLGKSAFRGVTMRILPSEK